MVWCCRLDRILGSRRLAGRSGAGKTLAEHAYRTEFHCSRELVTAGRTGALGLRAHGLTFLQPQPEPKETPRSTEWCEIGQHSAWHSVVPLHKRMRYITALSRVSEQNSFCRSPAMRRLDNDLRPLGAFEGGGLPLFANSPLARRTSSDQRSDCCSKKLPNS